MGVKLAMGKLAVAVLVGMSASGAQAFTLDAGSLLGIDYGTNTLYAYSTAGAVTQTLALSNLQSNMVGVEVIGSNVFVADVAGGLGQIDLTTGEVTSLFNVGRSGLEGLASINDNLLFLDYSTGHALEYSVAGALLNTFSISASNTGITGYGSGFATVSYNTGAVEFYNGAGVLAGGFSTFIGGASGLAYDSTSNSFWVSTGFGGDMIYQYSTEGTLLNGFSVASDQLNGLDFIASAVPEPGSLALFGAGLAVVACRKKQKAEQKF